ncbi:MAG: hypothetical protein KKF46_02930 [Nanoarchaeota archaeon]|nr:hypothetical protein [Nanoarchaeota archaeon]MBU1321287.1 hypothetical protein [Nanoarchaeota archaeon]MBU1597117.1 hypothetical protein [Nanoarchaeota archaeon]MBU2442140.1 hypothetical protein [Nanoarchaeota archaeon]
MKINIDEKELSIKFNVSETIFGLHGNFRIPLENIVSASDKTPDRTWLRGMRFGTNTGFYKAGTFFTKDGKEYWNYLRGKPYLTIELKDHSYKRITLGTENNKYLTEIINGKVKHKHHRGD